jgi:hypothetical protein
VWKQIIGKDDLNNHLIARNVDEEFSHVGDTLFGYTDMGKERGHTGDSSMAQAIYDGNLEHGALIESAIQAIVKRLRKYPAI